MPILSLICRPHGDPLARPKSIVCLFAAGCWAASLGVPAWAQANPLDRTVGEAAGGGGATGGAGQATQSAPAAALPDWVQPGAQVVYKTGNSARWAGSGQGQTGGSATDMGYVVVDVLAVAPRGVLVRRSPLAILDIATPNRLTPNPSQTAWVTPAEIAAGSSFFIDPAVLAGMQSGGDFTVERAALSMHGTSYNAVRIANNPSGAGAGQDSTAVSFTFEATTGILLQMQSRVVTGSGSNQRSGDEFASFEQFRQREGAWLNQTWGQWTAEVTEVHFVGTASGTGADGTRMSVPVEVTYKIQERGDGWVSGVTETATTNPVTRQREVDGTGEPFACSIHDLEGLWIGPQTLAQTPEGVVDTNAVTGTTVRYARDAAAQSGTYTTTCTDGSTVAVTYDLGSGLTTAVRLHMPAMGQTIELALQSYR